MPSTYTTTIKPAYVRLLSIYLGAEAVREHQMQAGQRLTAVVEGKPEISAQGTLSTGHCLSGMAKLYAALSLKDRDTLTFKVSEDGGTVVMVPGASQVVPDVAALSSGATVFERRKLKHLHIEPFRPENLYNWEPENETDIYLALGVLQENTQFEYCCATSKALLDELGAEYDDKPDAILIDRITGQYLLAEIKKYSSAFKQNHKREDVDVLICWIDDETDRSVVPERIVPLSNVARDALASRLKEGAD